MTFPVFPLTSNKTPALCGSWRGAARPRDEWSVDAPLWGIETGARNGVFVVDFDTYKGAAPDDLAVLLTFDTEKRATLNDGTHVYFKWVPGVTNAGGERGLVDIRGEGGYATVYGDPVDPAKVADAPAWLVQRLTNATRAAYNAGDAPEVSEAGQDALRATLSDYLTGYLDEVHDDRSAAIWHALCALARDGWDLEEAFAVMLTSADVIDKRVPADSLWKQTQKAFRENGTAFDFWSARPVLRSIRDNAHAGMVTPWTLLGQAILRVLDTVPHTVGFTSQVGTNAALNVGVVSVGGSGSGKSLVVRTADEALRFGGRVFYPAVAGSGEALPGHYAARTKDGDLEWSRRSAIFAWDEVGALTKTGARDGSTLFEYVKTAWSGGPLGRVLANNKAGFVLPPNSYRAGFLINAQPTMCAPLLSEAEIAGGFPQRLLWFAATDPKMQAPKIGTRIEPYDVPMADWTGVTTVRATHEMNSFFVEARLRAMRGESDGLDGHAGLTRAKVAVALMALDGRTALCDEDWELAGLVMRHSNETRESVVSAVRSASARENIARGKAQGQATAVAEQTAHEAHVERIVKRCITNAEKVLGQTRSAWRKSLASRDRVFAADVLEVLTERDDDLGAWARNAA